MAKSNFIVRGGADFSSLNKALNQTQARLGKFQSTVNKSMKFVGVALGTFAVGGLIKSSTKMAMSVESAMDNISRNMGAASKSYDLFANTQSKALGMARKDAYGYGSTFSNLLGSYMTDTKEIASETERLMRASAIVSSKTGRTFEDVANRIRSGMLGSTEAIEDLGAYTQVSMLESTEAFKKFANGKSWAQLDFKIQQQIREAAILEQIFDRYGDTLANTTQTKQAQFIASLENIKLNIGQTFLPIYNTVLPALTALAGKLEAITSHLAAFSMSVFGKASSVQVIEEQSEAITDQGNAIEQAGKQAKKAIAPFDEINMLTIGKTGAGTGILGGGGVKVEPVTTEASDKTGTFNDTIEKLKEKLEPTVKALGRFKDALEPVGKFVFDNIKSFYNEALKPIGNWVLGQGLPRLLDVGSGLLNSINWRKLTDALKNLWGSLAPFAISVGEGLLMFVETMGDILKPVLTTTADLLASAINAIAKAIKAVPEKTAIAIGGAVGGIAGAVLMFKGATAIAGIVKGIGGSLGGFLSVISKHPVLAIAGALAAIGGAIVALNKAKFKNSDLGKLVDELDRLNEVTKTHNEQVWKTLDMFTQKEKNIETEYGAIGNLADKYFELADNENLTAEKQALLKLYAGELIELIPELSGLIDEQTGAYKGTKDEITELIGKTKEYYLVQAAKEKFIELTKQQYENERILAERRKTSVDLMDKIKKKQEELDDLVNNQSIPIQYQSNEAQNEYYKRLNTLKKEIPLLETKLKEWNVTTNETSRAQRDVNKQIQYAEDYIASYSKQVAKDMADVKKSTTNALSDIEKQFKSFRLPGIKVPIEIDTSALSNFNVKTNLTVRPQLYAGGGFPSTGEMFIAKEAGPELVGRIGNRTAVANSDQIITGITRGVATANAEEVALLKQQNSLLQAILQKTGITTKSIYDAVVTENNAQFKRSGYSPIRV